MGHYDPLIIIFANIYRTTEIFKFMSAEEF